MQILFIPKQSLKNWHALKSKANPGCWCKFWRSTASTSKDTDYFLRPCFSNKTFDGTTD